MERRSVLFKKLLRFAVPILLLVTLLSGLIPSGQRFWKDLLQKAELSHFTSSLAPDELHIHVIDVGKADAILIESPETAILVDTGTENTADAVERYLAARSITELDAVWLSHADDDHIGGLQAVLQTAPVKEIVRSPNCELPALEAETRTACVGDRWEYGEITLEVLGPRAVFESENDNSLVFRLRYGAFSMLFCGDIEAKAEKALLNAGVDLSADVLKTAHHGSNTSSSDEFLSAVNPQYAVISVGEDRNSLPRNAVLKRLSDAGIAFYRTDEDGSVVISTDGETIHITTECTG